MQKVGRKAEELSAASEGGGTWHARDVERAAFASVNGVPAAAAASSGYGAGAGDVKRSGSGTLASGTSTPVAIVGVEGRRVASTRKAGHESGAGERGGKRRGRGTARDADEAGVADAGGVDDADVDKVEGDAASDASGGPRGVGDGTDGVRRSKRVRRAKNSQ